MPTTDTENENEQKLRQAVWIDYLLSARVAVRDIAIAQRAFMAGWRAGRDGR